MVRALIQWVSWLPGDSRVAAGLLHETIFSLFLAILHAPFLVSLNLDNPFNNRSSIILLSVHLFPLGTMTDRAASPSSHKRYNHSRN